MHRSATMLRTTGLLLVVSGLVLIAGSAFGATGLVVALLVAGVVNVVAYAWSDRIALRAMRAYPVGEVAHPALYRIVRELSVGSRQPMPRLYVSPTAAPNAFATGRDPRHASICCTEGLLETLDERELRAVLGHELAHVHNRDAATASITAALAGSVLVLAQLAWFRPGRRAGGGGRAPAGGDEGGGLLGGALLVLLAPLAAGVLQLGVSRSREYEADALGARLTGDPLGLASALRKLDAGTRALPLRPEPDLQTTSALMIANPFRCEGLTRLFGTHPPLAERVARLERLAGYRR